MKVLFWGKFIPLQGAEYIIDAAAELKDYPDIAFEIIGDGQTYEMARRRAEGLHNIEFKGRMPLETLPERIRDADVCLGIFGKTDKAKRVIPNKAYEAIAMCKALISADTPAMREFFTDGENILFCRGTDGKDLAEKVLLLKSDSGLREKIAQGGRRLFEEQAAPAKAVLPLITLLKQTR